MYSYAHGIMAKYSNKVFISWIIYMLHMDWKELYKLHKIICNRETVLVNTFTENTTIVHSEVLQMFV